MRRSILVFRLAVPTALCLLAGVIPFAEAAAEVERPGLNAFASSWRPVREPAVGWDTLHGARSARSVAAAYAARLHAEPERPDLLQFSGGVREEPPARPPGVAFLLSALLPGAGQLYNGNRRGYIFLGIEAAAWFARVHYVDAGNTKEGQAEAFARRHWDFGRYDGQSGVEGCARADSSILGVLAEDPDQFYRDVGREDAYRCGWDDFDDTYDPQNPDQISPNRQQFLDLRSESNSLKDNASLVLGVLVINRIVSAVDAFRTARSRQEAPALRLESHLTGRIDAPGAVLRLVKELP